MTTMDSDSESQDSDEGRRFRFETTRKDSNPDLQARRRVTSPFRKQDRRSRSRDRSRRDRKDDRSSHERKKNSRSSRDDRRPSKDRKSQKDDVKRKDKERDTYKEPRDTLRRDSRPRESKGREEKRRRSPDKSHERRDLKSRDKRERKLSKERERSTTKPSKHEDYNSHSGREGANLITDNHECKDLNLSDFDIVSDTEGNSDTLENRRSPKSTSNRNDERKKEDSREHKVKDPRNGDITPGPSNSNKPDALSDFLLGNTSMNASAACSHSNVSGKTKNCTETINKKAEEDNSDADTSYGPALPPSLNKISNKEESIQPRIIGPTLPEDFLKHIAQNDAEIDTFGPILPPHLQRITPEVTNIEAEEMEVDELEDIAEDDAMGPLPADHPALRSDRIQQQLEYRAKLIKEELAEIDGIEEKKREEWMTELPAVRGANLGLGPRKFRIRAGPDMSDRSGWTETPADRAKKLKEQRIGINPPEVVPNLETPVTKSNKRHEKSLLEMHQKKVHKKKKKEAKEAKEAGKTIRRPFDRDVDLQVNRFDESRKKTMLMKASALDDRFSRGKI